MWHSLAFMTLLCLTTNCERPTGFCETSADCPSGQACQATTSLCVPTGLSVQKQGSGDGQVRSNPDGILCGGQCNAAFSAGNSVELRAFPDDTSYLDGWSTDCAFNVPCKIVVQSLATVTAKFGRKECIDGWCRENPLPNGRILTKGQVSSLWGSRSSDIWGVSYDTNVRDIIHFDGSSWSVVDSPTCQGCQYNSIHGTGPTNVWAVGGSPMTTLIAHWDGDKWMTIPVDTPGGSALDVWALNSETAIVVGGFNFIVLRSNQGNWNHSAINYKDKFSVVYGRANKVWAASNSGAVAYYQDGNIYPFNKMDGEPIAKGFIDSARGIYVDVGVSSVWIAGTLAGGGKLLKCSLQDMICNNEWESSEVPFDFWGDGAGLYVTSRGGLHRYESDSTRGRWTVVPDAPRFYAYGLWGNGRGRLWIAGGEGKLFSFVP